MANVIYFINNLFIFSYINSTENLYYPITIIWFKIFDLIKKKKKGGFGYAGYIIRTENLY